MRPALNAIEWFLMRVLILVVGVQLLCVIWQFISRYFLGTPSTMTEEIAQLLLMWLGFLGAAHVLARRQHLAINLLGDLPPGPKRRIVSLIGIASIALFAGAVLVYGGGWLALDTFRQGQVTPTLRIPQGVVYLAIPISGLLMLAYCIDMLSGALGPDALGPTDPIDGSARIEEV
jgi:TRAP-type C4-dicarboxylate transport system permease small subunit